VERNGRVRSSTQFRVVFLSGADRRIFEERETRADEMSSTWTSHIPLFLMTRFLVVSCQEPLPKQANCSPGSHPCSDDSTQCCQDTTSSNFQWTIDTLGTRNTSFHDAYILNENSIWLVGEVWIGLDAYSAFHIVDDIIEPIKMTQEGHNSAIWPDAIWCFNDNDIWIAGSSIYHWNGQNSSLVWKLEQGDWPNGFSKVWGNKSHEMYFGGKNASIFKYSRTNLTEIPRPYPDLEIFDISGTPDSNIVFFIARTPVYEQQKSAVFKLTDQELSTLYYSENINPDGDYGEVLAVKVLADTAYIWTVKALWKYNIHTGESTFNSDDNYQQWGHRGIYTLDGNGPNDLFAIAGITTWFHFNGQHWYYDPWLNGSDVQCFGAVFKDDLVVAYGTYNDDWLGFYSIGRRY